MSTDSGFKVRSIECQQYLIAKGYRPHNVSKQFSDAAKISRERAQQPRVKMDFKVTSFLSEFNPLLPNLNKLIRNRLPLLYSDPQMKIVFPEKWMKAFYKRGKNLKKILPPSLFPQTKYLIVSSISNCNKRFNICINFVVFDKTFECTAIRRHYKVKELYLLTVSMWSA